MAECLGRNMDDHCCYISGKVCQFLEENTEKGFRWSCQLRRELGNWDDVLNDERYKNGPGAHFAKQGINCRDFPDPEYNGCSQCRVL